MRPTLLLDLAVGIFVALGVYGALWIADDLAEFRFVVLTYAGVPLAAIYLGLRLFGKKLRAWLLASLVLTFSPGYVALMNVLASGDHHVLKRTVPFGSHSVAERDVKRGALGMLYTTRW
jgi:hypothetical protein